MTKSLKIDEKLEKYISDHSYDLHPVQKEILSHNEKLGDVKKMQISITQAYFFQLFIKMNNIKIILGPAIETFKKLKNDKRIFDMIFIDADKENYKNYYNLSLELVKSNGFILIDNVLWKGDFIDPSKNDRLTNMIREFNSFIKKDDRVEKTILPLGDGITICRKI